MLVLESSHSLITIMSWILLQKIIDIAIVHPRGNETKTWIKKICRNTEEWKDVGVMELLPDESFITKALVFFSPIMLHCAQHLL